MDSGVVKWYRNMNFKCSERMGRGVWVGGGGGGGGGGLGYSHLSNAAGEA